MMSSNLKDTKTCAERALQIDANHGRAHFLEGKWYYDMVTLGQVKRIALRIQLPEDALDSAILHLEKCKTLEPYFMLNYLTLAKAYKEKNRPALEIEVLTKLVKLPLRTADDASIKAEGQKMLDGLL